MKLLFLHIPKAGGTTFHDILSRYYTLEETFSILAIDKKLTTELFIGLPADKREKINLLKGHMYFGLHTFFKDKDFTYITFLRNPIDRIVSHYNFIIEQPRHYLHKKVVGENISFADYALSDLTDEIDNSQVRLISGMRELPLNAVTDEILEKAKENIRKHFAAVGIMEKFDESLILLKQIFNWTTYPYYQRLNVTEKKMKDPISDKVRSAIEERNRFDMELYRWTKEEFERKIALIPDLKNELSVLKNQSIGFQAGYAEGLALGEKNGFNSGYNYIVNKFLFLKLGKKIKNSFSSKK